jgi:hypothetical protein
MVEAIVPIEYGHVDHEPSYRADHTRLFPNAVNVLGGGCIVDEETLARVRFCAQCRAAKKVWLAAHPGIRELGDRGVE